MVFNIFLFLKKKSKLFNSLQPSVVFLIQTSYLLFSAIQINGFYMEYNTRLKWRSPLKVKVSIMQKLDNIKYRKRTSIFDRINKSTIKKVLLPDRISWFNTRTISTDTAVNETWQYNFLLLQILMTPLSVQKNCFSLRQLRRPSVFDIKMRQCYLNLLQNNWSRVVRHCLVQYYSVWLMV